MWETSIEEINFEKQSRGISSNCDNQIRHTTMYKIFILERDIPYTIYKNSNQVSLLLNNQKRKEKKKITPLSSALTKTGNRTKRPPSSLSIERTNYWFPPHRSSIAVFIRYSHRHRSKIDTVWESSPRRPITRNFSSSPYPPLLYSSSSRKRSEKQTSSGREFVPIIRVSYHRRTLSPIRATLSRVGTAARGTNERTSELRTQTAGGINRFSFVWLISRRGGREKERGGVEGSGKGEEERRPV